MDSARQVVRWSIPGFVFVMELTIFAAAVRLAEGRDPLGVFAAVNTTSAVLGLLTGVPLGFLIYQLYYRNYRPFGYSVLLVVRRPWACLVGLIRGVLSRLSANPTPTWKDGMRYAVQSYAFVRTDRGSAILEEYLRRGGRRQLITHVWPEGIRKGDLKSYIGSVTIKEPVFGGFMARSFYVLKLDHSLHGGCEKGWDATICATCRARYYERFIRNWSIVVAMLDFSCGFPHGIAVKNEYTSGSDIYHALGAARTGIVGAWYVAIAYLLVVARPSLSILALLVGGVLISVLAFAQYKVLSSARNQVFANLASRTATGLAWFSRSHWQAPGRGQNTSRENGYTPRRPTIVGTSN